MRTSFDFSLIVEVLLYWIYKLYYRPAAFIPSIKS